MGKIESPQRNTVMAIGTNPAGNSLPNGYYSDIDVYSCRIYNRGLTEEEVQINSNADERRYKNKEIIPIYTEEQLLEIGTKNNYPTEKIYELKNNIELTSDITNIINKIKNGEIVLQPNEYQIKNGTDYYTSKSKYTISVNKYGYVKNGLELYLDGIDNTGNGHSSTTSTWKDLSGNNRNGTLKNFGTIDTGDWASDGLKFDGVDDYVPIAEMNYDKITMEAVITKGKDTDGWQHIVNNINNGGYRLVVTGSTGTIEIEAYRAIFNVYLGTNYESPDVSDSHYKALSEGKKALISGEYDGKVLISRSENLYVSKEITGTIKKPSKNTYIGLGGNMNGNVAEGEYFNGIIHCTRLYSRALTDEEQSVNFLNDRERFEL